MMIERSQPAEEPLTVAQLKDHSIISIEADDALLLTYLKSARQWAEGWTGYTACTQTITQRLAELPSVNECLPLPTWPISSLTSISQQRTDGTWEDITTAAAGELIQPATPAGLLWLQSPPARRTSRPFEFRIVYVAGTTRDSVHESFRDACRLIATESYEKRTPLDQLAIPPIIDRLLTPLKRVQV